MLIQCVLTFLGILLFIFSITTSHFIFSIKAKDKIEKALKYIALFYSTIIVNIIAFAIIYGALFLPVN